MKLQILSPDAVIFEGDAKSVTFPGVDGRFQVLNSHAPLIAALKEGELSLEDSNNKTQTFTINGGFVEVINNEVNVLAEGASA